MRLGDLDDLKVHISELMLVYSGTELDNAILNAIDNAPTISIDWGVDSGDRTVYARPQGEWVRKEDVIHRIAKQYSDHNELLPIWLSISDMRGKEE